MAESNPDYAGPEGTRLRDEANKFGDQRHQLMDASHQAFESGDKAKAKQLSEQGKEAGRKMEETHKKAAAVILKHRNEGHGNNYLDLHGLLLEEALTAVRERLDLLAKAGNEVSLELIPGAGHHSKAGAVIKPKVVEELNKRKLAFQEKNAGTLLVAIPGKATGGGFDAVTPAPAPAQKNATTNKPKAAETAHEGGGCCVVM